jgi:hypothetical protein
VVPALGLPRVETVIRSPLQGHVVEEEHGRVRTSRGSSNQRPSSVLNDPPLNGTPALDPNRLRRQRRAGAGRPGAPLRNGQVGLTDGR